MNSTSATVTSTETAPVPATAVPANEYERMLAAMPEPLRQQCQAKISGANFAANHPLFKAMADFYEKLAAKPELEPKESVRNFIEEATLHASQSKQLLDEFQKIPGALLGQIQPQLLGLLSALTGPVEKLEAAATHLQNHVTLLPKRPAPTPPPEKNWQWPFWCLWNFFQVARFLVADYLAWIVTGTISLSLAVIVLSLGASHLSRSYEESYQERLGHMEADSVQNTIALNRLLTAGIALKVERSKEGDAYYLILQGASKAAQPVNSPEGLAVEVWP